MRTAARTGGSSACSRSRKPPAPRDDGENLQPVLPAQPERPPAGGGRGHDRPRRAAHPSHRARRRRGRGPAPPGARLDPPLPLPARLRRAARAGAGSDQPDRGLPQGAGPPDPPRRLQRGEHARHAVRADAAPQNSQPLQRPPARADPGRHHHPLRDLPGICRSCSASWPRCTPTATTSRPAPTTTTSPP